MGPGIRYLASLLAITIPLLTAPQSRGDTLYRWIDEQGRPHFSDQPPPGDARAPEQLRMPAFAEPRLSPEQDPYSIINQVRRLEETRRQLARERREQQQRDRDYYLRQQELEAMTRRADPAPATAVYGYPRPFHPRPPSHRPRPDPYPPPSGPWTRDHPAYRPHPPPRPAPHRPSGGAIGLEVVR